ncbi:MAG TPA: radical SAM family heme chaperone HemW [Alphaproteobacteria bacterium]|jgi:oxygen-independent coproporphyrinogen-3 oxidase
MTPPPATDLPQLGLYVHWPFCVAKCPYCDFNSHVRDRIAQPDWRAAYLRALETEAARLDAHGAKRPLASIFFGGGTPSLMEPETTAAIIAAARRLFGFEADIEITLEANPNSIEAGRFAGFRDAGVNRVSVGIQALDDATLKFLGRAHDAAQARAAIALALKTFPRATFDLIYARPGQTVADWRRELDEALAYGTSHLSLYQLTIEKGTPFYAAHRRGDFALPDEETAAALFEVTQQRLADAGLAAYEISNHARPGQESRHNLIYWRSDDYLGVGPGAHGRLTLDGATYATLRRHKPEDWLAQAARDGMGAHEETRVTRDERLSEMLMMGLRLTEAIPRARFRRIAGAEPEAVLDARRLQRLIDGGFLSLDETGLASTVEGRQRLNAVLSDLLA